MKKIIFKIILLVLFSFINSYSQNYTITLTKYGYYKSITYWPTKSNPTSTDTAYNNDNSFVGIQFIQEPNENPPFERDNIFRSMAVTNLGTSNLNLAPNEKIDIAKLVVTTNAVTGTGNFNIKFIGNTFSASNTKERWEECNSGTYLGSLPYNSSNASITVTNIVKNNLGNDVYFGFYEGGNGDAHLYTVVLQIWTSFVPQVNITAKNNFENGTIKVGIDQTAISESSPYPFTANVGQTVNLQAVDQNYGNYDRIWNSSGVSYSFSDWEKVIGNNRTHKSYNRAYNFNVTTSDDGTDYIANLMKNYAITRKQDCSEFDNVINNGVVTHIVEQNSGSLSAPSTKTINGKIYKFAGWTDNINAPNPRTITPNDNETYTALYKYPKHSNKLNAYKSGSQNKFVRVNNNLCSVYESMGKIWIESSSDNGNTWTLLNNGHPLNSSSSAKRPSITKVPYSSYIAVTYQDGNSVKFVIAYPVNVTSGDYIKYSTTLASSSNITNANPVIASHETPTNDGGGEKSTQSSYNRLFLIVWQQTDGLYYRRVTMDYLDNCEVVGNTDKINNTTSNSKNPTITASIGSVSSSDFHFAWEEVSYGGHKEIRYYRIHRTGIIYLNFYNYAVASNGSGYYYNSKPSILVSNYNTALILWVGSPSSFGSSTRVVLRSRYNSGNWSSTFTKLGSYVEMVNGNTSDAHNKIVYSWVEDHHHPVNILTINWFSEKRAV